MPHPIRLRSVSAAVLLTLGMALLVLETGCGISVTLGPELAAESNAEVDGSEATDPQTPLPNDELLPNAKNDLPGKPCNTVNNNACASNEYCATLQGCITTQGTCTPKKSNCSNECPGICGCDGKFYCNVCDANGHQTSVDDYAGCLDCQGLKAFVSDTTSKHCVAVMRFAHTTDASNAGDCEGAAGQLIDSGLPLSSPSRHRRHRCSLWS